MNKTYSKLFTGIRQKCLRDGWFGPDALAPGPLEKLVAANPRLSRYTLPRASATDLRRSGFVHSPASQEQLEMAEHELGFSLPLLLRSLYTEVANGGFGPCGGIKGICGGYGSRESGTASSDNETIIDQYHRRSEKREIDLHAYQMLWKDDTLLLPYGEWPGHLLPFCDMGDVIEACVDEQEQLFFVSASKDDERYALLRTRWTLEEWLWRWVRDENLLELS